MKTLWSAFLVLAGFAAPSLHAQWPSVLPMSPSSGSGASYFFQFAYSDPQGYADIYYAEMLINTSLQAANGCYFYYHRASNVMYLSADNGSGWVGSAPLGGAGTLENSQCKLNLPTSSASGSGNNLNVTLALTFKSGFTGTKNWYSTVEDVSGHWAGWHTMGTWTVPDPNQVPAVLPMSPSSGSGSSQTFQFGYSDPQGYGNIYYSEMLMNTSFQAAWSCYFYYHRASNVIYLSADNGSGWVGSAALGSAGTLQNSQCSLSLPSSSAVGSGNTLTVYLALTFQPEFVGTKNWYATVEDNGGLWAGWSAIGTWTVVSPPAITTSSPLPNGTVGVAYSQTLSATGGTPPYSWSVVSGSLPPGLSLSSGGVLSGTPSTVNTYNFTVQVSGGGTGSKAFALTIGAAVTITTSSPLPNGTVGVFYSQTLAATGGTPPYCWSVISGSLPPGLSLSSAGLLSGTPTTAGTSNFTVQVSGGGTTTKALSVSILIPIPTQWRGINYSPRQHSYFRMLNDWYPWALAPVVDADLQRLKDNGFNLIHLYLWDQKLLREVNPDEPSGFTDLPGNPNPSLGQFTALDDFVGRAEAKGLYVALHFACGSLDDRINAVGPQTAATEFATWTGEFIGYLTPTPPQPRRRTNVLLWGLAYSFWPIPGDLTHNWSVAWQKAYKLVDAKAQAGSPSPGTLGLIGVNLPMDFLPNNNDVYSRGGYVQVELVRVAGLAADGEDDARPALGADTGWIWLSERPRRLPDAAFHGQCV